MIQNEHCIVWGGAGSIGSELVRQLSEQNSVHIFDIDETRLFDLYEELKQEGKKVTYQIGDIKNIENVETAFRSRERDWPRYSFITSAYKHVSPMDLYPEEAVKTNVLGLSNILRFMCQHVFISSDKAVNPKSVMGMTKRIGEIMVRNAGGISVRFANVLGSRGSVIPIWQKQIDERKPLTITHPEMTRYFMTIPQAVKLVIDAAEVGEAGDIVVLDMGQPIKIIDLAKKILQESGLDLGLKEIGIRPGESMKEELMTNEEKEKAVKKNGFWIIKP